MRSLSYIAVGATVFLAAACTNSYHSDHNTVEKRYVHRYGVEIPQEDWDARGQHGQVITKLKTGVIETKNYSGGQLHGEATYTFPHHETIQKIENYHHGELTQETEFYYSGLPHKGTLYRPDGSKTVNIWYENGCPQSVEDYEGNQLITAQYYGANNQVESRIDNGHGVCIQRDSYGQLISHDIFEGGLLTRQKTFHPNGSPKEIVPYRDGHVEGKRQTFLPAGEPNSVEEWIGGKQQGITTIFQNGEKASEIAYVNGQKNGMERRFANNGEEVVEEITWKDDEIHGPCTRYIDGRPEIEWYFRGQKVTKFNFEQLSQKRPF